MAIYSIRDLEKLTGIKMHTIRMWEQRYGLIVPQRTETNIRYYTDSELRHLFNIALLNRNGVKINKIAKMSREAISLEVERLPQGRGGGSDKIDALTMAMLNLNEYAFETIFSKSTTDIGFEKTMETLVYPLLENLKALWITKTISPAHEKFITHLLRRKMMRVIDEIEVTDSRDQQNFLLYLPEGESQELTLLFVYYLLRKRNFRVVYLGGYTSPNDLRDACQAAPPGYVFSIIDSPLPRQSVQNYINQIATSGNNNRFLLTGSQLAQHKDTLTLPENVSIMNSLQDMLLFLDRIRPAAK